jgi:hypothetical protein
VKRFAAKAVAAAAKRMDKQTIRVGAKLKFV